MVFMIGSATSSTSFVVSFVELFFPVAFSITGFQICSLILSLSHCFSMSSPVKIDLMTRYFSIEFSSTARFVQNSHIDLICGDVIPGFPKETSHLDFGSSIACSTIAFQSLWLNPFVLSKGSLFFIEWVVGNFLVSVVFCVSLHFFRKDKIFFSSVSQVASISFISFFRTSISSFLSSGTITDFLFVQ